MTKQKIKLFTTPYFIVIRTSPYVEVISRCTGHGWIIREHHPGSAPRKITLHHKHKRTDYYHDHAYYNQPEQALKEIINHDKYVLSKRSTHSIRYSHQTQAF